MAPLRQRMTNDMTLRGVAENTKRAYQRAVIGLASHYHRSPEQISAQEVHDGCDLYLIFFMIPD